MAAPANDRAASRTGSRLRNMAWSFPALAGARFVQRKRSKPARMNRLEEKRKVGEKVRVGGLVRKPAGVNDANSETLAETEGFEPSIGLYNPITV